MGCGETYRVHLVKSGHATLLRIAVADKMVVHVNRRDVPITAMIMSSTASCGDSPSPSAIATNVTLRANVQSERNRKQKRTL